MQALERYESNIHGGCGNHASVALDKSVARVVEHRTIECEDCRAINQARKQFHETHVADKDGDCPCSTEIFWVDKRIAI